VDFELEQQLMTLLPEGMNRCW